MFGFGQMFPVNGDRNFTSTYRCSSVSMLPGPERKDVNRGGKIIMPPSALDQLTRLNIQYPMLFKLTNKLSNREMHCGVLEFVAGEGRIYLPYWMMNNLLIEEDGLIQLDSVSLPVATFTKFQPQSTDFLDITDPKAVLENALRSFACLTTGDVIAISYNARTYEMEVLETKPGRAVSIIETDMNVEFAPPVGYVEPDRTQPAHAHHETEDEPMPVDISDYVDASKFRAFSGSGNRLDGKKKSDGTEAEVQPHEIKRGIPNYDYKKGKITFIRARVANGVAMENEEEEKFEAFSGEGNSLRKKQGSGR